jgi:hypothetical protein
MAFEHEKRIAARTLRVLEDGELEIADLRPLYEEADPVLVHAYFTWLRNRYHPGHPAAEGVLGRIARLCQASPAVAKAARDGATDPIIEWLEETWDYRDLDRDTLVSMLVDKLEG